MIREIEYGFNDTMSELNSHELCPKFYGRVQDYLKQMVDGRYKFKVLADSRFSCIAKYHGYEYHISYDWKENKFKVEYSKY